MVTDEQLEKKIKAFAPYLNERQLRLYLGHEALSLGRGGMASGKLKKRMPFRSRAKPRTGPVKKGAAASGPLKNKQKPCPCC
jgi:hypothetical protein